MIGGIDMLGRRVRILRGKRKGREGVIRHRTSEHPLAPGKPRWALWVYHPQAKMLLMHEDGFEVIDE